MDGGGKAKPVAVAEGTESSLDSVGRRRLDLHFVVAPNVRPRPNGSRLSCGRPAHRRKDVGRQSVPRQGHNTPFPFKRSPPVSFKRLLGCADTACSSVTDDCPRHEKRQHNRKGSCDRPDENGDTDRARGSPVLPMRQLQNCTVGDERNPYEHQEDRSGPRDLGALWHDNKLTYADASAQSREHPRPDRERPPALAQWPAQACERHNGYRQEPDWGHWRDSAA